MIEKQENYNTQEELEMDTMENMEVVEAKVEFKVEQEPEGAEEISEFEYMCGQYDKVNKSIDETNANYDLETEPLKASIKVLQDKMAGIKKAKYETVLKTLSAEKEETKAKILTGWEDKKIGTVKNDFGTFTRVKNEKLVILNQEELIADLTQKGLLNKVIKSFDDKKLKSWFEDEVIEKGITVEDKPTLRFTVKK